MSAPPRDFANASVIPRLPDWRDSERRGEPLPPDLVGARIVRFGAAPKRFDLEGGGLIIDYIPKGRRGAKRLVLAFNELGMWRVGVAD